MAEDTKYYLKQCLERNICPACQEPITEKIGSGKIKDGVFYSLDCFTEWNNELLIRRHKDRVKKSKTDE